MTTPNPLAELQAMMEQGPEQSPETDALSKLKAQQEQKATELGDMGENLLRGLFQSLQNPAQTTPDRTDFDQRFRQNNSPAREVLANMFQGMSSSFAGTKYKAVREQAWQQELVQAKMKEDAIKADQMYKAQIVKQLQDEVQSRRQAQTMLDAQILRQQLAADQSDKERKMKIAQFAVRNNIDWGKVTEMMRHNKEMEQGKAAATAMPKDPYMQQGLLHARAELQSQGVDINAPEIQNEIWDKATKFANDLYQTRQQLDEKYKYHAPKAPPYQRIQVNNPWGEIETGLKNAETGQWINKPEHWNGDPKNFTAEQTSKLMAQRSALDAMRLANEVWRQNPSDISGLSKILPASLRQIWDGLPTRERTFRVFYNAALSQYILGMSGVATSGHEEQRLKQGLGKDWENPKYFAMGSLAFQSMLEAQAIRKEAGIDPNELDLGPKLSKVLDFVKMSLDHNDTNFRVPRAQELIEEAAQEKGKKLIYDAKGRLRGMK